LGYSKLSQQLNVRLNSQVKSITTQIFKEKGVDVSRFFNNFSRRLSCAVSSFCFNSDQYRCAASLCGLHRGGVLERVSRKDTVIVICCCDQGGWELRSALNIVIGRVGIHRREVSRIV